MTPTTTGQTSPEFRAQCEQVIEDLSLASRDGIRSIRSLTGGVSSDIAHVQLARLDGREQDICIKCALPQLRVAQTWQAPLHRNLTEYRWLQFVAGVRPESVPRLLGHSPRANGFAMQYLSPEQAPLYKSVLLDGEPDNGVAALTGQALVQIHSTSTSASLDRTPFVNAADFHAIRLEPYLDFTATRHPDHAETLLALSQSCSQARIALIHGDVSPKNLLIGPHGPIFLDAECATFGDPAFDLAFFTNHLLIKSIHLPGNAAMLLNAANEFWQAYQTSVTWEDVVGLERRFAALLPALMLARVDGKSPVEYLQADNRDLLRTLALRLLTMRYDKLRDVIEYIAQQGANRHA